MPLSIVLVRPEIPENIGFTARTLKCYGLADLRIAGLQPLGPHSPAYVTGAVAREILEAARFFPDTAAALAGTHLVVGFTKRRRDTPQRVVGLKEAVPALDLTRNIALVFGGESQGLAAEDCLLCDRLVRIDTPNRNLSLNLSHAVTVVLHEICTHGMITGNPLRPPGADPSANSPKAGGREPGVAPMGVAGASLEAGTAPFEDREATFGRLLAFLRETGSIGGKKGKAREEFLRGLWLRAAPDRKELDFLLGVIERAMVRKGGRGS